MDDDQEHGKLSNYQLKLSRKLRTSIRCQFLKDVKDIIDCGWNVNQLFPNPAGRMRDWVSALHLAIETRWMECVQYLVETGADVNLRNHFIEESSGEHKQRTEQAFTPLMQTISHSSKQNKLEMVQYLIENGADPNLRCSYTNHSAITTAIKHLNYPIVSYLLENCNIDLGDTVPTSDGFKTVLEMACENITDQLLQRCPKLHLTPELQTLQALIIHGADVNASFIPLQHLVCLKSFNQDVLKILNLMYHKGLNVDAITHDSSFTYGPTALCEAVKKSGHFNYIRWLLRHGANTNRTGLQKLFTEALYLKEYTIAEVLLRSGVPIQCANRRVVSHIYVTKSTYRAPWGGKSEHDDYDEESCLDFLTRMESYQSSHREQQETDLLDFSTDSLYVYQDLPKDEEAQVKRLYGILCQPPKLKQHCRSVIRQCLVSPHPCIVQTLLVPAIEKQYILCHDI